MRQVVRVHTTDTGTLLSWLQCAPTLHTTLGGNGQRVEAAKIGRSWREGSSWYGETKRAAWLQEEELPEGCERDVGVLILAFWIPCFTLLLGLSLGNCFLFVYFLSFEVIFGKDRNQREQEEKNGSTAQCTGANLQASHCVSLCGGFLHACFPWGCWLASSPWL